MGEALCSIPGFLARYVYVGRIAGVFKRFIQVQDVYLKQIKDNTRFIFIHVKFVWETHLDDE